LNLHEIFKGISDIKNKLDEAKDTPLERDSSL